MTDSENLEAMRQLLESHLSWDGLWIGFASGVGLGITLCLWHVTRVIWDDTDRDL